MPVFVLSIHADYACRHSGACCAAGWRIPVEPACEKRLVLSGLERSRDGGHLLERGGGLTVMAFAISRYLAGKAFASWISWQAGGVATSVAALWAARAVLRVEAGRQCRSAGRILDRPLLVAAIRQADLLLVHQVSSQALADGLAAVEQGR